MNAEKFHCSSSPMDEHKTENSWSECFQDLGSWCRQPQDELNTPNAINQNEFNFSFDDQSMYYSLDANTPSVEFKGDMWKPQSETDLLPLQLFSEEDNNSLTQVHTIANKGSQEASIRYSGNLVLTQCPYEFDQIMDSRQDNIKPSNWTETRQPFDMEQYFKTSKSQNTILDKRQTNEKSKPPTEETTMNKSKPSLKLNISAASKASTSLDIAAPLSIMNTPDVYKSISEDSTFNLFSYVGEGLDDPNLFPVDPSSIISQKPKETPKVAQQIIKIEHDYAETSPQESSNLKLLSIKNEDEEVKIKQEKDNYTLPVTMDEEPHSFAVGSNGNFGKRIRKSTVSDDFIFDEDPPSDHSSDWSPVVKKKCKTVKKKSSGPSTRCRTSSISDSGSVTSGPDRYRELRDRNNEASRRSRMNRKQKENEMMERASILLKENVRLKARSAALERRVKSLREILLKVVLEKNK